jgi:DNA end-binding protein Ku
VIAVKELVDAKLKHLPSPKDNPPRVQRGNVVNRMDALRKSVEEGSSKAKYLPVKKPVVSKGTSHHEGHPAV